MGEVTGPGPWRRWFESKFSSLLAQFKEAPEAKWPEVPWEESQQYKRLMVNQPLWEEEVGESRRRSAWRKFDEMVKAWEADVERARASYERGYGERWKSFLAKKAPEERREYGEQYPYGISGRPWAMAPGIETLSPLRRG